MGKHALSLKHTLIHSGLLYTHLVVGENGAAGETYTLTQCEHANSTQKSPVRPRDCTLDLLAVKHKHLPLCQLVHYIILSIVLQASSEVC